MCKTNHLSCSVPLAADPNTDCHQAGVGAGQEGDGSGALKGKTDVFIKTGGGRRDDNKVSIQILSSNLQSCQQVHHYMLCSLVLV